MGPLHFGEAFLLKQSKAKQPSLWSRILLDRTETRKTAERFNAYIAANYPDADTFEWGAGQRLVLTDDTKKAFSSEMQRDIKQSGLDQYEDDPVAFGYAYEGLMEAKLDRYVQSAKVIDLDA